MYTYTYTYMCMCVHAFLCAYMCVLLHRRHLRETLVMSNKCDLNKLTACSLILLGQIFLSVGNTKVSCPLELKGLTLRFTGTKGLNNIKRALVFRSL